MQLKEPSHEKQLARIRRVACLLWCRVLFGLAMFLLFGTAGWFLISRVTVSPEPIASLLTLDFERYEYVEWVSTEDLTDRLYYCDQNVHLDVLASNVPESSLLDELGRLPVVLHETGVCVATYKWFNLSRGLAGSKDPNFVDEPNSLVPGVTTWPIEAGLYGWDLEMDQSKIDR